MKVALVNYFHSGDCILSRALIKRVRPLLLDKVELELRCHPKNMYLWQDLGLPVRNGQPEDGTHAIDMWFGAGGDLLGVSGLTHATQVTSYNRQAEPLGLPLLDPQEDPPPIDFNQDAVRINPGILIENGPVLSGQKTHELNPYLTRIAKTFPHMRLYCTGKIPEDPPKNVVDCSRKNLIEISTLSNACWAMLARLSGPFVASLTQHNVGRLKRLVLGEPIGCPIWDERDVEYFGNIEDVIGRLRGLKP
jgi:hypothetical protein